MNDIINIICTTIPNRIVHEKALDYYSAIIRDHAPTVHLTAKRSLYEWSHTVQ